MSRRENAARAVQLKRNGSKPGNRRLTSRSRGDVWRYRARLHLEIQIEPEFRARQCDPSCASDCASKVLRHLQEGTRPSTRALS